MANLDDYIWLGVTVDGQFIKRNDDIRIVQYQVGKVKLTFTGSSEWDGMDIIARFRHSSIVYDVALTSSQAEDGMTEGECVIPHEITDIIGSFEMALRGENDDGLVITSDPTTFTVVETIFSGDSLGEPEPATPSILKQILDGEATRVSNEQARVTAESARVSAEATRQSQFTTAINNANAATENANDAAALAKINVPYNKITGSIASMTDADNGAVMKELTVHGKTVQNLWVNPSGGEQGMTATPNADGSVTIVAQRSGQACPVAEARIYGLQEGKTYTLIVDPPTPPQSTWPSVAVYINGSTSPHYYEGTFEMGGLYSDDQGVGFATATIWVNSMDPINQRYRIMLVEGETAEPWCPPGLTSVNELETVTAGKNLLKINSDLQTKTVNGVTFTPNEDGTITVNGTSTDTSDYYLLGIAWNTRADNYLPGQEMVFSSNARAKLYGFDSSGSTIFYAILNGGNQIISAEQIIKAEKIVCYLSYGSGQGETNKKVYAQLELGSTATAYEPPHVTTTPIDLSGHQLRSLPDGTSDVLTVDGSGAVSVEQAIIAVTLDGSEDEYWVLSTADNGNGIANFKFASTSASTYGGPANVLCDTLPPDSKAQAEATRAGVLVADGAIYIRLNNTVADTVEELKTWLAANPTTIIWKFEPPWQTVHLPPVTPPILRSPTFNVWAATDVPTTIDLSYGWDASGMLNQATPSLCREGIRNLFM